MTFLDFLLVGDIVCIGDSDALEFLGRLLFLLVGEASDGLLYLFAGGG